MNTKSIVSIISIAFFLVPAHGAKIYKWEDGFGITHISSQPPKSSSIIYQTIISAPKSPVGRSFQGAAARRTTNLSPKLVTKVPRSTLSRKNIIIKGTSEKMIREAIIGAWSLKYKGGQSKLTYNLNGDFQYKNNTKRATFTHKGTWQVYQRRNRWFVSHKGKYFTKTKYGKIFKGAINDLYIVKKLSGKKLVLLEAKNRKHIKNTDYDLNYFR